MIRIRRWGPPVLALVLAGCGSTHLSARPPGVETGPASAWPEALSTAAHTSATSVRGPQTGRVAWTRALGGAVTPGPAVGVDGSILAASNAGVLHALDPATGRDRWTYDGGGHYGSDLSTTPAVLADGTILWPAPGDRLVALSSAGHQLWTLPMAGFVLSPAVGTGGRVYVADATGRLDAVDVGAGGAHHVAWTLTTAPSSFGSPALGPDGTVFTTAGHDLYAVTDEGGSGRIRWHFDTGSEVEVSAAVAPDGTVVVGTNASQEYGVSPSGALRWQAATTGWSYSSAVVSGGRAYAGDNGGDVDVVDADTGALVRRDTTLPRSAAPTADGVGIWTAPLVDGAGDVYVASAAGHAYGFAPDGRRLWDLRTGGADSSYPALTATGLLVLGSSNGTLYAIG